MTDVVFASIPLAALAFAESIGADRAELLSVGGLQEADLADPDGFVEYDRLLAVWDALTDRFAGRPLGMEYGDQLTLQVTGVVGLICANAPTLRAALDSQLRFNRLLDPRLEVWHEPREDFHRLGYGYELSNRCIPDILEMLVTTTVRFARALTGIPAVSSSVQPDAPGPRRVFFAHSQRHDRAEYERRTGCPVVFDATWTGIEFLAEYLDVPLPAAQPDARRYLARHAETLLDQGAARAAGPSSVLDEVRRKVEEQLLSGVPSAQMVATQLGMSPRTLQRRLEAEGTTFSALVDSTRRGRALQLLAEPGLTAQEVAFALGYSEPRAFHRAFRRWTGMSPGEYRMR